MSGFRKYVAIDEFSLNVVNNGNTKTLNIKVGDALDFDDIEVKIGGVLQGSAAALRKVKGEWIEEYKGSDEFLALIQEKIRGKSVKPQALRRIVANAPIEHSSPNADNDLNRGPVPGMNIELKKIVNEAPNPDEVVKMAIINDDQREVKRITSEEGAAETRSSSSVELSELNSNKPREIVSDEESIAKVTSYPNTNTPKVIDEKSIISNEEDAVMETSYKGSGKTDISSSTQAQIMATPALVKKPGLVKSVKNILTGSKKANTNDALEQDGVVVKKGSPIVVEGDIRDIQSTLTIGAIDEGDDGAVTFGSNKDIDDGDATFGSSGDFSVEDISTENSTIVTESEDDIDVSSLLDNL